MEIMNKAFVFIKAFVVIMLLVPTMVGLLVMMVTGTYQYLLSCLLEWKKPNFMVMFQKVCDSIDDFLYYY